MTIQYEQICMLSDDVNIKIIERKNDSHGQGCEFHWHEQLEFYYVVSGGVLLSAGGQENWLYSGDVGFVNSFLPHRGMRFLDNTLHYIIQIDTDFFRSDILISQNRSYDSFLTEYLKYVPCTICKNKELSAIFSRLILEQKKHLTGFELAIKSCVYEIFSNIIRISKPYWESGSRAQRLHDRASIEHVKNILRYLSANYMHPQKVSLDEIAKEFALSKAYICRIFKDHTNATVMQYLTDIRVHNALAMIHSGISLQETCTKIGISDYNYFSRMIKKATGHSPIYFKHSSAK